MNPYADVQQQQPHHHHMSAATGHHISSSGPPPASLNHYPHYSHQSLLQPSAQNYSAPQAHYAYNAAVGQPQHPAHAVNPSMNNALVPQPHLALPAMSTAAPAGVAGSQAYAPTHTQDTTGQMAPPGMKPKVTATLWEDEGSLCFQVEAKGVCVARREDNHMINGTKLLNVAGMTRGRRDGILKSEKQRHVVKIGPMHLKGVWIPFDRALEFANKEKITELLYPLFVHDIGALLYHPQNQNRNGTSANAAVAAGERRQQRPMGGLLSGSQSLPQSNVHQQSSPNQQATPVSQHATSTVGSGGGSGGHVSQSPHPLTSHSASGRPSIDRSHTFPTPPTSASSLIGMSNSGNSYEWGAAQSMANMQGGQPLSIDTGMSNNRSVPNTPASTPPGNGLSGVQQYQASHGYDATRQMYGAAGAPPHQGHYGSLPSMGRYGQSVQANNAYIKNEMAPPARTVAPDHDQPTAEAKPADLLDQSADHVSHAPGADAEAVHETDYAPGGNTQYGASRGSYPYGPGASVSLAGEQGHMVAGMTSSPHQNGSGHATPRTASVSQTQWDGGYSTSQRPQSQHQQQPQQQAPSSNLYSVMGATNGNSTATDSYSAYPTQYNMNGAVQPLKRGREPDEQAYDPYGRPSSRGEDYDGLKRRKTVREDSVGGGGAVGSPFNREGNNQPPVRQSAAVLSRRR